MAQPCIFCQQESTLTGEHLWSRWIGKLFDTKGYEIKRVRPTGEIQEWNVPRVNLTAKVVCARCNNEWMSDLEKESKSLLKDAIAHGRPFSLLPLGVSTLAAFAFKGAIISDNIYRQRRRFFSVSICQHFRKELRIPFGTQMWAACLGSGMLHGTFKSYVFRINAKSRPLRDAEFFSFTWGAGHLILQVLAVRGRKGSRQLEGLPILTPDAKWNHACVRFWPNDGSPVTVDPTYNLSRESLEIFRNRWSAPVISNIG